MGGFLSHPAKHFPERFSNNQFLKDHPYALPCFVSSAISLVAFIIVALFFREVSSSRLFILSTGLDIDLWSCISVFAST